MVKKALIVGITGQDGSYLAELLLEKGYEVHGIKRQSSSLNTQRIDNIYKNPDFKKAEIFLHYGDLTDGANLTNLIQKIQPDEIYNLGAQSHVAVSFESPELTANINALGTLRLLEAIKLLNLIGKTRFYQASTSELFGLVQNNPQNEKTPFYPRSPYAVSKLYAYWITINYREAYGMYACNGILFNHESPRRGSNFVTKKITRGFADIALGQSKCLYLGNLKAKRDWGHAKDYVRMQWLMLQQDKAEDFVIASGEGYTVKDFINMSAEVLGLRLEFKGEGLKEFAVVRSNQGSLAPNIKVGDIIVRIDKKYYRPLEVDSLFGDASKASTKLNWKPKISVKEMCKEMVLHDLELAKKELNT